MSERARSEDERILAAFRSTKLYRQATKPMVGALVEADSLLSLVAYRQPHLLRPDLRQEFVECSQRCRRLSEEAGA